VHNQVLFLCRDGEVPSCFRTGVSLHGHTSHSLESLGFIGKFLRSHSALRSRMERWTEEAKRKSNIDLNFDLAYWTPPLAAEGAYELERGQIESLGLHPIVSLSDHDNIEASTILRRSPQQSDIPISVEWTVPFGRAVFHLGIHNIPAGIADELMAALQECTAAQSEQRIVNLLSELRQLPSLLVIFNHPVWNFSGVESDVFNFELTRFLQNVGRYLDAFELNGMRGYEENREVIRLAAEWNQILISGGDRHACEPSVILNLTTAVDFPEFIEEVRNGRQSTVLMMPQYQRPLNWRIYEGFTQIIRDYPDHPQGRQKWNERTFHPDASGKMAPLSVVWPKGSPNFLKKIFALAALVAKAPIGSVGFMRDAHVRRMTEALTLPERPLASLMDSPQEEFAMPSAD
jgi:hypothetical protein